MREANEAARRLVARGIGHEPATVCNADGTFSLSMGPFATHFGPWQGVAAKHAVTSVYLIREIRFRSGAASDRPEVRAG